LFASDHATIARRAARLFAEPSAESEVQPPSRLVAGRKRADFPIPPPRPLKQPIDSLRVTQFRSYLACPYRFYLSHVLNLQAVDDESDELDGGEFGSLIHIVLKEFGNAEAAVREATSVETLRSFFSARLDDAAQNLYGASARAAVAVQIEQIRKRLDAFADAQARRAEEGWRIMFTEQPAEPSPWPVDGATFHLRGRIDRIDLHAATGRWRIWDYKSSDSGDGPDKTHRRGRGDNKEWVDLQLPLYRHLARSLGVEGDVGLGYILLPKDPADEAFVEAAWSADDLARADETARNVVRAVRRGEFFTMADPPPDFSDDLAPICQDNVFDRGELKPPAGRQGA
jgi:hypothetical protein